MGLKPKTPEWIEQEIRATWSEAKDEGRDLTARELRENLKDLLKSKELVHLLPSLRKVQLVLTKARADYPKIVAQGLDTEWSLAASKKHRIPPEADGDLLRIWRFCRVVGRRFTIREALWASRLRQLVPLGQLLSQALDYSRRERFSDNFQTADLDARIAFIEGGKTPWLHCVADDAGVMPPHDLNPGELSNFGADDMMVSFLDVEKPGQAVERKLLLDLVDQPDAPLNFSHDERLSEEGDMVYALRLRKLSEELRWDGLDWNTMQKVARHLHKAVAGEEQEIKQMGVPWLLTGFRGPSGEDRPSKQSLDGILEQVNKTPAVDKKPTIRKKTTKKGEK
ncbi:MAG: hypothetical protein HY673_16760 [Chloroflexi bacterium]|nr:hypothetical protein [Chloroflexota bacterium]